MGYKVTPLDMYGWAMYFFDTDHQRINIAFMHMHDNHYMLILFAEDGSPIINPHEEDFMRTFYEVVDMFDAEQDFTYETFAE